MTPEKATTRRTVVCSAVWSIPVIATAVAAPAAAASVEPPTLGTLAVSFESETLLAKFIASSPQSGELIRGETSFTVTNTSTDEIATVLNATVSERLGLAVWGVGGSNWHVGGNEPYQPFVFQLQHTYPPLGPGESVTTTIWYQVRFFDGAVIVPSTPGTFSMDSTLTVGAPGFTAGSDTITVMY